MLRIFIILFVFSEVNLQMQTFQHQVYVSRKSRSNTNPVTVGFVYNKAGEGPGVMTTFDNTYRTSTEKYAEMKPKEDVKKNNAAIKKNSTDYEDGWRRRIKDKELYLSPKQNDEYAKAKTKYPKFKDNEAPGTINLEAMSRIRSNLYPNTMKEIFTPYVADKEFKIDEEDVRTDSRNTYNRWPYSFNGPYDYQVKNLNAKNEKAKDKRFLDTTIIPVHQNVVENIPVGYISNAASSNDPIIDNPIYGDQPFFSFVLNDYFDRHHEEEPLIFKDFSWGEEFDNGLSSQDIEDNERRNRRLQYRSNPNEIRNMDMSQMNTETSDKESVTRKAYDNSQEYEKNRKGSDKKDHQDSSHNYKGQRETAFKDFADLFANKFGSEEHNKQSNFMLKTNQDKGEKRKGFKRVYHKDEFQEDNEFYDNSNKSVQSEESGSSNFNIGGSQSFLQSQTGKAAGDEAISLTRRGNKDNKMFENNYKANERRKEQDGEIKHYRNIAKDAALSNNADYIDNFRI